MPTGTIRTGNSTGIGTGTTKTEITPTSALFMPSDARALLKVIAAQGNITPTAAQTSTTKLELESQDLRSVIPFEALFPIIGAGLGATFNTYSKKETWMVNAPLAGGEGIHVYATALAANTTAPECQAFAVVSNDVRDLVHPISRMVMPQRHYKLGTLTATGTTADTDVAGTKYNFSGGREIVQLFGGFHPKTIAAGDMFIGEVKYVSSEFDTSYNQTLPLEPMSFGLGATGSYLVPQVSREDVRIPLKPGQVNVQDYLNFGGVIGTAGSFIDGVCYV